jgi:acyl-CoA thioesterase II
MPDSVAALLGLLDLEQLEINLFRGVTPPSGRKRVFGGQVVAQALVAANRTVDERQPHSLHAYFLLGGDPRVPIIYEVERIRDGRSFTTRRVVAIQHGEAIFVLSASYHRPETGFDHQSAMPAVPSPEELPDVAALRETIMPRMPPSARNYFTSNRPIELRPVEFERYADGLPRTPVFHVWFRATAPLPDNPGIHQAVLAYASDMTLLDAALVPHGRSVFEDAIMAASLDHALWLHRPFRADEWLLYAQDSPSASGARGFARGLIFNKAGQLVASVAQEGLLRLRSATPVS